jgi:hypothetical protein
MKLLKAILMNSVLMMVAMLIVQSCKIYSFSGANINPNIKSISISYFNNDSGNGPAIASDLFTNSLKEKMLNSTTLRFENYDGDVQFEGKIIGYNYSIQAPTGGQSSDLRRISMTVQVTFVNNIEPSNGFENMRFTRFADFPVSENLEAIEERLIEEINIQLVDDIFNKAFVRW